MCSKFHRCAARCVDGVHLHLRREVWENRDEHYVVLCGSSGFVARLLGNHKVAPSRAQRRRLLVQYDHLFVLLLHHRLLLLASLDVRRHLLQFGLLRKDFEDGERRNDSEQHKAGAGGETEIPPLCVMHHRNSHRNHRHSHHHRHFLQVRGLLLLPQVSV